MTYEEALQIAMEELYDAVEVLRRNNKGYQAHIESQCNRLLTARNVLCKALEEAEEQSDSECVAIVGNWGRIEWQEGVTPHLGAKLFANPPKREWVGLNDSEINEIQMTSPHYVSHKAISIFLPMIEAKLKEKNT
jgi:hypothetical protein